MPTSSPTLALSVGKGSPALLAPAGAPPGASAAVLGVGDPALAEAASGVLQLHRGPVRDGKSERKLE